VKVRSASTWVAMATFALGITVAAMATAWQRHVNRTEAAAQFADLAPRVARRVAARMQLYEYGLRGVRGAVVAAGAQLDRQRFHDYCATRDLEREFPGVLGFGLIRRVAATDEASFVAAAGADGGPDFAIRQLELHAGERYVVQYVEPASNRSAMGLDVASESGRRTAAEAAMRDGGATLTPPITLVQATGRPQRAFLLLLPIYQPGAGIATVAQREAATIGWAFAPLVIDDVLRDIDGVDGDEYALTLRDAAEAATPHFYGAPESGRADALRRQFSIPIFGRTWRAELRATPRFTRQLDQRDPRAVALVLAALALVLATLAGLFAQSSGRTRRLGVEQARRAAIVDGSTDAIIGESLDGLVTDWNAGAERLFGYPAAFAVGRAAASLVLPPGRASEDAEIRATIARGAWVAPFDTTRRLRDGTLANVSVTASPMHDRHGRCFGMSKTVRDISEARRAQRALADLNASLEQQVADRTARLDATLRDLRNIVDALPSMIGYWNKDLTNRVANRAYSQWFGLTPDAMNGRQMRDVLEAQAFERTRPYVEAVLRGEPQSYERSVVGPDDSGVRHLVVHYLPDRVDDAIRGFYVLVQDLTELTESRLKLDAALRDLRTIVDAVPSLIGYWDTNLHNRVANRAYSDWFGVAPDRIHGRHMREVVGDEMFERNLPLVEAVLRGEPATFERSMPRRDGPGVRHALGHYLPDIVDGEVRGFYVLVFDITELTESRLKLAAAQRDNEALQQTIQQHLIVSVTDRAGRITEISDSFCRISGYSREELLGRNHRLINSGTQGDAFWIDTWRTVASGHVWRGEVCNRAKDGSLYWVDSIISPFLGPDGAIEKYISIRTDVTARKRAETELLETSSLLKAVLAAASEVSIIASDVDGLITLFNRGAERLLGYDQAELVGRSTRVPLHLIDEVAARGAELSAAYGEPIAGFRVFVHEPEHHGPETREWTYVRKDGGHVPVSLTMTAMRDDRGQLFGYLGVAHDVSRQREQERSLRDAVHKAKHANRAKSQFLANMSHEIRTPMNAVIGLSYLLEHTKLDAEQAGFLAKLTLASKSLLLIINDVLDLSKIEANELTIERAPFHLGTLLGELSALTVVQADARRVDFAIDAPGDLPLALEGDSTRLHQILTNLLSNAIKFTERGAVALSVRQLPAAAEQVQLRFVVKDSGIGIAPEALACLFSPFAQADASTTRRFGGTGLGLSIVKRLVGLMGGELGVSSTPGVGSEFWVELPFAICADAAHVLPTAVTRRSARRGLPGVRVLVADDSAINLEVARRILEMEGAVVRLAGNGQEAIDELLAHPGSCDVVLMDIHMPVLDGYDATRRIRSGLGLTRLPIIALTAGTLASEQQQAESAGMSDFVSKPFDPQLLVSCIRRHVPVDDREVVEVTSDAPPVALERWPAIDGIDTADVRTRLGGDVGLFTSMLRRLVDEFSDLGRAQVLDASGLDGLAARMHKLKGNAGTLGARSIQRSAAAAEMTCRAHQAEQTARLLPALAQQLHRLQQSAASMLEAAAAQVVADDGDVRAPLDRAQLAALRALLRQLDLAALPRFAALSPQLRRMLGNDAYAILHQQIDDLQFADAARTLEALDLDQLAPAQR